MGMFVARMDVFMLADWKMRMVLVMSSLGLTVVEDRTPLKGRNYAATSLRWLNHVTCLLDEMPTRKSHTNNQSTIWCLEKARSDKTPPKYKTCYVVLYDSVMDPTISSQFTSKSTLKQSTTLAKTWSEREHQRQKGPTEEQSAQKDG